jgi:hypothetical protein
MKFSGCVFSLNPFIVIIILFFVCFMTRIQGSCFLWEEPVSRNFHSTCSDRIRVIVMTMMLSTGGLQLNVGSEQHWQPGAIHIYNVFLSLLFQKSVEGKACNGSSQSPTCELL